MRPVNNNIIIRLLETKTEIKSAGGIVLKRDLEYPTMEAEVLAVSDDLEITINVGDIILLPKHEGIPFTTEVNGIPEVVRLLEASKIYMVKSN
jgi:co-chaperonin GroES (HSP10)